MGHLLASATPPPHQPPGVATIVCVAFIRAAQLFSDNGRRNTLIVISVIAVVLILATYLLPQAQDPKEKYAWPTGEIDPFAGGHPVPPLPGQTLIRTAGPVRALDESSRESLPKESAEVSGG